MSRFASAAAIAAALVVSAGAAGATTTVTFNPLAARFTGAVGGDDVAITPLLGALGDPAEIRWGVPFSSSSDPQSGYEFDVENPPLVEDVQTVFDLGVFTHFNQPIESGGGIDGVTLEITGGIGITPDGGSFEDLGEKTFSFFIDHDETPNNANPCLYGGAAVNANGCADRVLISEELDLTETFDIDGVEYTLDILGFFDDATDTFDQTFLSPEEGDNQRVLRARFTEKANVIPVPAGVLLIGSALLGAGAVRRFGARRG